MTRRISLELEIVLEEPLVGEALPALQAAKERGDGALLVRAARGALPRLRAAKPQGAPHDPDILAWKLAVSRLEAVLATDPSPPSTEAALEEVAWALLRAARAAPPVSIGEDWDLLRVLLDPGRRRGEGLGAFAATLGGAALAGSGPLAAPSGFALARELSYATGWNAPSRTAKIARALVRFTPARLEAIARRVPLEVARTVWPRRTTPLVKRLPRALAAFEKLEAAYGAAARAGAGVFLELLLD